MSILDHNQNYEANIEEISSPDTYGKFFWFSGYDLAGPPHYPPNRKISFQNGAIEPEDDDIIYEVPLEQQQQQQQPLKNGYHDENIYEDPTGGIVYELPENVSIPHPVYENSKPYSDIIDGHVYERPDETSKQDLKHKGTFFKLNGEYPPSDSEEEQITATLEENLYEQAVPDEVYYEEIPTNCYPNADLPHEPVESDDDDYSSGTWFSFAGHNHRAQSMENLLQPSAVHELQSAPEDMDSPQPPNDDCPLDEQFKMIDQLVLESFDDLGLDTLDGSVKKSNGEFKDQMHNPSTTRPVSKSVDVEKIKDLKVKHDGESRMPTKTLVDKDTKKSYPVISAKEGSSENLVDYFNKLAKPVKEFSTKDPSHAHNVQEKENRKAKPVVMDKYSQKKTPKQDVEARSLPSPNSSKFNDETDSTITITKDDPRSDEAFPKYTVLIKEGDDYTSETLDERVSFFKNKSGQLPIRVEKRSFNEIKKDGKKKLNKELSEERFIEPTLIETQQNEIEFFKLEEEKLNKPEHSSISYSTNTFPRSKKARQPLSISVTAIKKSDVDVPKNSNETLNSSNAYDLPLKILNNNDRSQAIEKSHSFHSSPRRSSEGLSLASKISMFNQKSFDADSSTSKPIALKKDVNPLNISTESTKLRKYDSPRQMRNAEKVVIGAEKGHRRSKSLDSSIDAQPIKRASQRVYVTSSGRSKTDDFVMTISNKKDHETKVIAMKSPVVKAKSVDHGKNFNYQVNVNNSEEVRLLTNNKRKQNKIKYEYKNYLAEEQSLNAILKDLDEQVKPTLSKAVKKPKIVDEAPICNTYIKQQESELPSYFSDSKPHSLKRQQHIVSTSSVKTDYNSDFTSDEENHQFVLHRNRSFRRSIVIEDEVGSLKRSKSIGGTGACVSVFFTPISHRRKSDGDISEPSIFQQYKELFTQLDNMVVSEINFGKDFEAVKRLHSLFWELKDAEKKNTADTVENLMSVLNYLVVQEWPKIMLGCFKKLRACFPHVFKECKDIENVIYYSGHLPSLLRMNRTSSEFAISVIFDGLLKAAINFTEHHEASRIACCEDNLIGYLLEEIVPQLHHVHWGKVTAREMFFKSISDLVYNCAKSSSNASYLIEHDCVNIFTEMREETFDVVDARKVNMTMLLTLSYLIDDNNYDIVIPREDSIIRLLQYLDRSLEHSEHCHQYFSALELAKSLSRIATHDTNKVLITRNSGQEILHKLFKYAYNDEERIAACDSIWTLAFCTEAKDILRGMGKLMNLLRESQASQNANLRRAASGILWECEEKYDIKGTRETNSSTPNHVMVSYEYEAQPLVIGIRDELHRQGYKVWMNIDGDERSLQEIMTRGVERASVVIAVLTRKYKQTPHCFAEIDYAYKLRKLIIPVIIDVDYVPDGWLGQIINIEKTFDFSRRSMFNGSLDALMEYTKSVTGPQGYSKRSNKMLNNRVSGKSRSSDVLTWSNSDVIDWLKENQLIRSVNNSGRLEKLSGLHLLMFFDLKKESPDYYYSILDSHLGFKDVLDTLEFTYALDRLLGTERLI